MRGSSGSDWHGASRLCLTLHSQYAHAFALRACALFFLVTAMRSDLVTTTDYEAAFTDADIALLVGARPRGKGMLRSDLLQVGFRTVHARVAFVARAVSPTVTNSTTTGECGHFRRPGEGHRRVCEEDGEGPCRGKPRQHERAHYHDQRAQHPEVGGVLGA